MYIEVRGTGGVEDVNKALKHLSKIMKRDGILEEIYKRREFVKPSRKIKLKKDESRRRKRREERRIKKDQNSF
jgi:ribosomal protein S21